MVKKKSEKIDDVGRKISKLEREYRNVKEESRRIKSYFYALSVAFVVLIIAAFAVLKFTGFSVLEFSSGSLGAGMTGETSFSHLSTTSDTAPYYYDGGYGSTGLKAYYSFDGDNIGQSGGMQTGYGVVSGTAYDYSSNDYDGTYGSGVGTVSTGCKDGYGRCASFSGSGDNYINGFGESIAEESLTTTLWVYPTTTGSQYLVSSGEDHTLARLGQDKIQGDHVYCANAAGVELESIGGFSTNEWVHIACVYSTTTLKIYINGAINRESEVVSSGFPGGLRLGSKSDNSNAFSGKMDEVMIFGHALSADEISAIYNAQSPRFGATSGIHSFTVALGTNSTANITLGDYVLPAGTNISVQINSSTTAGAIVNFTNGVITNYALPTSGSLTSAKLNIIYYSDANKFFSPVAGPNVSVEGFGSSASVSLAVNLSTASDKEQYSFINLDNSLVGWWRGEDNADDDSGYGNNGTLNGNTAYVTGKFGNAFDFDGVGDYVSFGCDNLPMGNSSFTLSAWLKTLSQDQRTFLIIGSGTGDYGVAGIVHSTGKIYVTAQSTGILSSNNVVDDGNWHQAVITYNSSNISIFVDGNFESSAEYAGIDVNCSSSVSGIATVWGSDKSFNGSIDDVLIFNRTLSAEEIASLYNATANQYYHNFTGLSSGTHTVKGYMVESDGTKSSTSESTSSGGVVNFALPSGMPKIEFSGSTPANGSTVLANSFNVSMNTSDDNGGHYSFLDFDNSLVGWWRGEGNANDSSGYGNNGTLSGNANASSPGKFGSAFGFDGSGDYITMNSTTLPTGASPRTVSAWVKVTSKVTGTAAFSYGTHDTNKIFGLYEGSSNWYAQFWGGGQDLDTGVPIGTGVWQHHVLVFNGTYVSYYLNGTLRYGGAKSNANTASGTLVIGAEHDLDPYFNGYVDDLIVFNRTLSAAEVKSLYNSLTYQYSNTFTSLGDGNYTVKGYAIDTSGNVNSTEIRRITLKFSTDISPSTCSELKSAIEADCTSNYLLLNNIDCTGEEGFEPICSGGYNGTFDGGGHTITGLYINYSGGNAGLFAYLNGAIENIGLVDVNVVSYGIQTGALVGYSSDASASISNSYSTGNVFSDHMIVGGLAGTISGYVVNSYSSCNVTGLAAFTGGLVGVLNSPAFVNNSYATGNVTGEDTAGGLVGYSNHGSVYNSYSTGNVSASVKDGNGLVGQSTGTITNSYWYNRSQGLGCYNTGNTGCTSITTLSYFYSINNAPMNVWDFTNVWSNTSNGTSYPPLAWQNSSAVVAVDTTAPYFTTVPANATLEYSSSLGVDFEATDETALGSYYLGNWTDLFQINSSGWLSNKDVLPLGTYIINVTINDTSGNTNMTWYQVVVSDTTAPYFTTIPANATLEYSSNLNVNFLAKDVSGFGSYYLGNWTDLFEISWSIIIISTEGENYQLLDGWLSNKDVLPLGTYIINVTVNDTSGNTNMTWYKVVVQDTTFPLITAYSPENLTYTNASMLINFSATDDNLGSLWFNNGTVNITYTTPITVVALQGSNTYTFYVNDSAGNVNSTAVTFSVDSVMPQIAYATGTENDNEAVQGSFLVNVSITESNFANMTYYLYYSNGTIANSTAYTSAVENINWSDIADGDYIYEVNVTDTAGNTNTTGARNIKLVSSCLTSNPCSLTGECIINGTDCILNNNLCSGICTFTNLTISKNVYTLYDTLGNANALTINLTSNVSGSSITFLSGNKIVFSGRNGTDIGAGSVGGNASIVNITVYDLFNTTGAFFEGTGGYTTLAGANGGNGGIMQLNYHGLIGKFLDVEKSCGYDEDLGEDVPCADNTPVLNAGSGGSAGNITYNKNLECLPERDSDGDNDGLVYLLDYTYVRNNYNAANGSSVNYSESYDYACRNKLNVVAISRVGLEYGRGT